MKTDYNAIRIAEGDNVATVTEAIAPGETVRFICADGTVELISSGAPKYHKIALEDIPAGGEVRKYGEVIAVATEKIPRGAHVHTHNVTSGVGQ